MADELTGKTVLITGPSSGIGRAMRSMPLCVIPWAPCSTPLARHGPRRRGPSRQPARPWRARVAGRRCIGHAHIDFGQHSRCNPLPG